MLAGDGLPWLWHYFAVLIPSTIDAHVQGPKEVIAFDRLEMLWTSIWGRWRTGT